MTYDRKHPEREHPVDCKCKRQRVEIDIGNNIGCIVLALIVAAAITAPMWM